MKFSQALGLRHNFSHPILLCRSELEQQSLALFRRRALLLEGRHQHTL